MIISIASGKGGTGKTLLAASLARAAGRVTLIDCDVEEPNAALLLKPDISQVMTVTVPVPAANYRLCTLCGECARQCRYNALAVAGERVILFNNICHSCGLCREVCPEAAISEEQRSVGLAKRGQRGQLDFLSGEITVGEARATPVISYLTSHPVLTGHSIRDCPPGTSCAMVEAVRGSDFCIMVTEPTPFGRHDLELALNVVRTLGIKHGVVVNRDGICDGDSLSFYRNQGAEVLLSIPHDIEIARGYARGKTLGEVDGAWNGILSDLFRKVLDRIKTGLPTTRQP